MTSIWMAPEDPITSQFAPGATTDFMDLFTDAGAWQQVAAGTNVFKLYSEFVTSATDAQLQEIGAWAKANNIQLAMESGVLITNGPGQPGWGVEGYNGAVVEDVQRLTSLGVHLSYVAMDEPLYFGSQWTGTNAAGDSTASVASQAADTIKQMQAIDPTLQVGDIEPIPLTNDISNWIDDLQADTGEKLAFFDADVVWGKSYQAPLASLASTLHADGITYGVIINGDGTETSNTAWTDDAIAHFVQIQSNPALAADQYVFQTWNPYPTQALSEDTPGTLTNVMLQAIDDLDGTTPIAAAATSATSTSAAASATVVAGTAADTTASGTTTAATTGSTTGSTAGSTTGTGTTTSPASTTVTTSSAGVPQLSGDVGQYAIAPASLGGPLQVEATGSTSGAVTISAPVVDFADGVLVADPTGTAGEVARLYEAAFTRAPDLSGLQYWTADIDSSSIAPVDVAQSFVNSPELQALYGSLDNTGFVGQLYQNVLGRGADTSGEAYWVNLLQSGTSRGQVLLDFAQSNEEKAETLSLSGDPDSSEATRLYQAAFDRAPSGTDLAYWASSMQSGTTPAQIAQDFVNSSEFGADFSGLSGAGFVTQLYENVLGRMPDASGLQYWTSMLQNGGSEAGVLQGFADSAENLMRTATTTHAGYVFLSSKS